MYNQTILSVGRLVSTTDLVLARKLGQVISLAEISRGRTVRPRVVEGGNVQVTVGGEFYELAR